MSSIDWFILLFSLGFIVIFGAWKTRKKPTMEEYLITSGRTPWYGIGISVILTQASAITFLSTPGQAYENGMGFIQFYFGLPLAIVVICLFMIPRYQQLKVLTAYEYLESCFDQKTRQLAAFLFLIQRGLAAGLTIYAPAIILSSLLHVDVNTLNVGIGIAVTLYTVAGGAHAVNYTQFLQMGVIFTSLALTFILLLLQLPDGIGFTEALTLSGAVGKMDLVDFSFDTNTRYTFWSGITGGFFLALSYFGTDQSQVGRYLTSKSTFTSQVGLLCNAIVKVPMQFLILLLGVLIFTFYLFALPPLFFNEAELEKVQSKELQSAVGELQLRHQESFEKRKEAANKFLATNRQEDPENYTLRKQDFYRAHQEFQQVKTDLVSRLSEEIPSFEKKDSDHVVVVFILNALPMGVIGLLFAAILSAAMSSTSSELNALSSTWMVDVYRRSLRPNASAQELLLMSRVSTLMWGILAMLFATIAPLFENLIQAVNIVGSLFYGTILGIFLVAFGQKKSSILRVSGDSVFYGALIGETAVISLYWLSDIGFLWFNVIGCVLTIAAALILERGRRCFVETI
ncbi:MAG: sodium:solute symporter [Bdellovibrionales bacterium]|nr:sodium:solute symporter [Bdellovibrionales bacterium]